MVDIFQNYCSGDSPCARFLTIYIEEAHARDEWRLPTAEKSESGAIDQHVRLEDRLEAARKFVADNNFPIEVVCDSMENHVSDRFEAWPERLYIIQDSVVVYQVSCFVLSLL